MKQIFCLIFLFTCMTSHTMEIKSKKSAMPCLSQMCLDAIQAHNVDIVEKTLSQGADVNYVDENGKSLFFLACTEERSYDVFTKEMAILKLLVSQKNINPFTRNFNNCTPLHGACQFGILDTIEEIFKKAPETVHAHTKQGNIPLHATAHFAQTKAMRLLLAHNNANINVQDYKGNTALHIACDNSSFDVIELLITHDAQTIIKNNLQQTAFFTLYSAHYYDLQRVEQFINNHPDIANKFIHATDADHNNQLHLCSTLEFCDTNGLTLNRYLLFLISQGISIHARNKDKNRVIDLVCKEYNTAYNQYLTCKTELRKNILINAEKLMHLFLRFTSPFTECILFKEILHKENISHEPLPNDIEAYIAYLYYALNIETIIAKKYASNNYYHDFIENKNEIKQKLLAKPKPHLLWNA